LIKENKALDTKNTEACSELVGWRVRAEAAELELKSLGKLATTEEEKRSLALARLLNSKVVGVDVGNLPIGISSGTAGGDFASPHKNGPNEIASPLPVSRSPTAIEASRREAARQRVITSQDILEQAWNAQRALAERLDRDIAMAGGTLGRSVGLNMSSIHVKNLTGYSGAKVWR
jgi:hypothetical protein